MTKVIIFISSLKSGGTERVTVALCKYLADSGYKVTLVTLHDTDRDFFSVDPRVFRACLGLAGHSYGIHKLFGNINRLRALRVVIKKENPMVVIGMTSTPAILSILACFGLDAKVVASERNYPARKVAGRPWALLRKIIYRFADAHVAQTQEGADWIIRHAAGRNVHVIPNSVAWPVPSGPPRISPTSVVEPCERVVLAVGTKAEQKGFDMLLSGFALASGENSRWRLIILGLESSSSMVTDLVKQAKSLGINGCVRFPGRVGNVAEWYQRADIFVLSSRYEGFPNVLLEAMAAGCPSIAYDCDTGPRAIIDNETNGLLVPAGDVDELAGAMRRLMESPQLRECLGAAGMAVRECFSEAHILPGWQRVIDELAA